MFGRRLGNQKLVSFNFGWDVVYNWHGIVDILDMEKIVVVYQESDECTYCYDIIVPLVYSSLEAFIVDFDDWADKCLLEVAGTDNYPRGEFVVGKHKFQLDYFRYEVDKLLGDRSKTRKWRYDTPEIYTLDEWFNKSLVN